MAKNDARVTDNPKLKQKHYRMALFPYFWTIIWGE